jgi:hypothetical protein
MERATKLEVDQKLKSRSATLTAMKKELEKCQSLLESKSIQRNEIDIKLSETVTKLEVVVASANSWKHQCELAKKSLEDLQNVSNTQTSQIENLETKVNLFFKR